MESFVRFMERVFSAVGSAFLCLLLWPLIFIAMFSPVTWGIMLVYYLFGPRRRCHPHNHDYEDYDDCCH